MNKILNIIIAVAALTFCFSCNNEWEDEQFAHYVGFKAPINSEGCTSVYLKMKPAGELANYKLPLVVSGSTPHSGDLNVKVELDLDTLEQLNLKNIGFNRQDIWWEAVPEDAYTFPSQVTIPSGQAVTLMDINIDLTKLDLVHRYILPLRVSEDQPGYTANTRKHYNNALLNIIPFNDFSGSYGASTMLGYSADDNGNFTDAMMSLAPLTMSNKIFYAVDDNTVFFYPGIIDHTYKQRADYKVFIHFDQGGALRFEAENQDLLDFQIVGPATYDRPERQDENKPYLLYKYVILQFTYDFTDHTGAYSLPLQGCDDYAACYQHSDSRRGSGNSVVILFITISRATPKGVALFLFYNYSELYSLVLSRHCEEISPTWQSLLYNTTCLK